MRWVQRKPVSTHALAAAHGLQQPTRMSPVRRRSARTSTGGLRTHQRGVALLTAILLVALGTILAAGIAYQNAMVARRGTATFAFDQSLAIAEAAEALAAYALAQDAKESAAQDYPAENWAKPFGPVEVTPGIALEAKLDDVSGRFNLNSLVNANGVADENAVAEFKHLLRSLDMEEKWASLLVDWIDRDHEPYGFEGAEDSLYSSQTPAYRTPDRPISSTSELLALREFGRDNYLKLAPYIVALPQDAKLNICTAPGPVLDAMTATAANPEGRQEYGGTANVLEKGRQSACFPTKDVFAGTLSGGDAEIVRNKIEEKSKYFRLTSIVSVGNTQFALYSLLYRNGAQVRPIMRSFSSD